MAEEIALNVVLMEVPSVETAPMMNTAINAVIRPYSSAVTARFS